MEPSLVGAVNPAYLWTPWTELGWDLFPRGSALISLPSSQCQDTEHSQSKHSECPDEEVGTLASISCRGPAGSAPCFSIASL